MKSLTMRKPSAVAATPTTATVSMPTIPISTWLPTSIVSLTTLTREFASTASVTWLEILLVALPKTSGTVNTTDFYAKAMRQETCIETSSSKTDRYISDPFRGD